MAVERPRASPPSGTASAGAAGAVAAVVAAVESVPAAAAAKRHGNNGQNYVEYLISCGECNYILTTPLPPHMPWDATGGMLMIAPHVTSEHP